MFNKFLIAFGLIPLLVSCTSDSEEDVIEEDPIDEVTLVTYEANISELISNRCLTCHNDPPTRGAPVSFNTFDLVSEGNDLIINSLQGTNGFSIMPPSGALSASEIELFQKWIDDGLLEN